MEQTLNYSDEMSLDTGNFRFSTIVSIEEASLHDLIYVSDKLKTGDSVLLVNVGANVRGDLRYRVDFKGFTLGYTTISGFIKTLYEGIPEIWGEIAALQKRKYLPASKLDIKLQCLELKKVS